MINHLNYYLALLQPFVTRTDVVYSLLYQLTTNHLIYYLPQPFIIPTDVVYSFITISTDDRLLNLLYIVNEVINMLFNNYDKSEYRMDFGYFNFVTRRSKISPLWLEKH